METILGDPGTREKSKRAEKNSTNSFFLFLVEFFFPNFFQLADHSQEEVKVFSEGLNFGNSLYLPFFAQNQHFSSLGTSLGIWCCSWPLVPHDEKVYYQITRNCGTVPTVVYSLVQQILLTS